MKNPKFLTFFVTNACNAQCPHCFNWKETPIGELTLKEIKKIDFTDVKNVALTGGEPTIRKDLKEICLHISKYVNNIAICSNGLLTKPLLDISNSIKNITFQISIDGTEKIHDKLRGKGAYKRVMKTLKSIPFSKTTIVTTISKVNKDNIDKFIFTLNKDLFKEEKIPVNINIIRGNAHVFNLPKDVSYYHNPRIDEILLSLEEVKEIYKKLSDLDKKYRFWQKNNRLVNRYIIKILEEKKKMFKCYAGYLEGILHSNGDISFCEYTKPFANLRDFDYDLNKLWNSSQAYEMRKKINSCFCIHPCNLLTTLVRSPHVFKFFPFIIKDKLKKVIRKRKNILRTQEKTKKQD